MSNAISGDIFNLIRTPWLPVRRRSSEVTLIAPWQITDRQDSDPITAFDWPRPDFNGAAHEFLIGLLSTAATPQDEDEWRDWQDAPPAPEQLRQRFERVAHAFDLDGPGPRFLQDLDSLADAEEKDVATLLIDAPGAQTLRNNADLFVKRGGVAALGRAAAAMALFTLSAYAPSGGAGHRTSLRGGGPLTSLIVAGETLWERLWPNVEAAEQIAGRAGMARLPDDPASVFPWLGATRTSDPKTGGKTTTPSDVHPLQVYWGMPRRIRLIFSPAEDGHCGLTGLPDEISVSAFRTRNYGINYSEGFLHPLSPYYMQKAGTAKLPVHPQSGGIGYRHWPGLVVAANDKLREPAQAIRHALDERSFGAGLRFAAFGYDMDNMKARAWVESEMPLLLVQNAELRELAEYLIRQLVAASGTVARLLTGAVKAALYDRPADAGGDFGFVSERFWRTTEQDFYDCLRQALHPADGVHTDPSDPTREVRLRWVRTLERVTLRLFDEFAPAEGLEDRNMERHVKARFFLALALRGQGKAGAALFGELNIPTPETSKAARKVTA